MTTEVATPLDAGNQKHHKKDNVSASSLNNTDNNNNNTSVSSVNLNASSRTEQQIEALMNDPHFKFPLENTWSFWFYKNDKNRQWKDNVMFIINVDYVEDFWG